MDPILPFNKAFIENTAKKYPTPFHIYDETRIKQNSRRLNDAMRAAGFTNFRNFFAVKALPNPHILKILVGEGQGLDCSSLAELELAHMLGVAGPAIMFTSNNTSADEFARAHELGVIINFDDISHVDLFLSEIGVPEWASCRFNPGNIAFEDVDESIIGKPAEAKYGMTKDQVIAAYRKLKEAGAKHFGLHTMLLSNDLGWRNHALIADVMFGLAKEIYKATDIKFEFINLGGGIGVPYRPADKTFDVEAFSRGVREAYDKHGLSEIGAPNIVMENGRFMTADAGYLVARVINRKETYKTYIGLDASMSNLMRPGMYGAYHHITVLGKESDPVSEKVDVTGSLCENNDKFAVDRELPEVEVGDLMAIHTSGAHGHAMGFQYNGKLRSGELLLHEDKSIDLIRRAETINDYFATLYGDGVKEI